jgi:hypothetical protein
MRFQLTGHRAGTPVEVQADSIEAAIIEFQWRQGQRVIRASGYSEARQRWEAIDDLLESFPQFDGSVWGGQLLAEPNTGSGQGHPAQADWVIWHKGVITGYVVDSRDFLQPASAESPEDEDETPFEAWWGGSAGTQIGSYHSLRGAATAVTGHYAKSRKL